MARRRAEKVEKRKRRTEAKRVRSLAAARRRQEEDEEDEAADRSKLEPLAPLFERGVLAAARFDVAGLPAEAPRGDPAQAVAEWFLKGLPELATPEWRERARAALAGLRAEAGAGAEPEKPNPDLDAIDEALFWLEDAVATGLPALENTFFRFVFERTCEAEAIGGRLPAWVAGVFGITAASSRSLLQDWRRDRAATRLTFGPFLDDLPADDIPAARELITGPELDPGALSAACVEAAEKDLTPERRSAAARRLRAAADREEADGRALAAFDLRTLAAALESDDPLDLGLARLYYTRSVYRRREDATAPDSVWPT